MLEEKRDTGERGREEGDCGKKKGIQGRGVERRGIVGGEGEKRDTGERDREEWRVVDARN